jgi:hypothetical protein
MNRAKLFDSPDLEALAKVLEGAATHAELHGLFHAARLTEPEPLNGLSKWKRIFNALAVAQNKTGTGNFAFHFIQLTVAPKRFVNQPVQFEQLRDRVNRDHYTKRKKSYAEFENSEGQCPTESADASANEAEVKGYRINQLPEKRRSNEVLRRRLGSKRLRQGLNVRFFPFGVVRPRRDMQLQRKEIDQFPWRRFVC